jgi:hypothetical protein
VLLAGSTFGNSEPLVAKNGVLDLRNQKISENIDFNGEWLFYWNELISEHQDESKPALKVNFPGLWTSYNVNGQEFPSFGYALIN